ncbi:SDR family oxidoreductase [Halodesulfovibrio marinisediminis]|uniref:Short-chain dehydrogenase n=1 Tax=Halodesulfovibrio marinisediminis DSM 17456 TaxID=1121457 RepID=A0A1N6EB64_9BACT|nr:SDR family oxidoreductase [Halodesulfovibrio marinisediminis]SIN80211.1 Short-chain dehydrogenase [Halodesulfovibrio marinisediminis DSM 17456]
MTKSLLILGASSDIALDCARSFARAGFDIILAARDIEKLEVLASDIRVRSDQNVYPVTFDARNFTSHEQFTTSLPVEPDGVICAFGYLGDQLRAEKDFNEAKVIIDTNFTGAVSLLSRFAQKFEERGAGFIVGISSVAGDRGRASNYVYGSAKAGFTAFLSGLRNRLNKKDVQIITVKPGFVHTAMTEHLKLPDALTAQPEEVASDILAAVEKKKDIVYSKPVWRLIMLVIVHIPEFLFKRLSL